MSNENFYTSVEHRGDNILVRGYKDGRTYAEKIHFEPSLYYPMVGESEYHSPYPENAPLRKKKYDSIKDMKDSLKTFQGVGNHKYYGTTNIIRQFIADYYPGEIKWNPELAQVWFFDIETTVAEAIQFPDPECEILKLKHKDSGEEISSADLDIVNIHSPYVVWENGEYKALKDSKYRVKGFPSPDKALEQIQLISMYNYTQSKGYIFSLHPVKEDNPIFKEGADFQSFETEKELLTAFIMFMRENWIDILAGWNSALFDVPYLTNRIKKVHGDSVASLLSPWKIIQKRTFTVMEKEQETYEWLGICLLDYLEIYKKFNPGSQESFKLDHIAEIEIGKKKVESPYDSFVEFYEKDWGLFCEYNWRDSTLLRDMEKKMQLMPLAMMVAFDAKINVGDCVSAMRIWESTIYNHFLDMNQFMWANEPKKQKRKIPGAYVHDPIPGKYKWAVSIDATSMYPSAIMQNNISPETKYKKINSSVEEILAGNIPEFPEGYILSPNGVLTSKEREGFIPLLIRKKFDQRKTFKKQMLVYETEAQELRDKIKHLDTVPDDIQSRLNFLEPIVRMLDIKQKAVKTASNSFYGVLLLEHFSQYDPDLGEAITLTGQVTTRTTLKVINEFLNRAFKTENVHYAILADTDSVYFTLDKLVQMSCEGMSEYEIVSYLENFTIKIIQPLINNALDKLMAKLGIENPMMVFKLECIGPAIVPIAKKRYAFDILYSEGVRYEQTKMKVIGMEIVRSSTPSVIKDKLKVAVKMILAKEEADLQKYLKEVKTSFMNFDHQDIAFPRGCNGLLTYSGKNGIYESGCPIHVRAALLHNHYVKKLNLDSKYPLIGEGEKIKFLHLKMPNPIHENVIGFLNKLPEELGLLKYIDYDTQFQKAFLKPIEGVMAAVGWEAEERINLEDFF